MGCIVLGDIVMSYFMFITLLCVQLQSFAQDSISKRFAVLYDAYRITKGMNPLCYAPELDSFSTARLAISIEGNRDCFLDTGYQCQGDKDLHFKFLPMVKQFNKTHTYFPIIGENMAYRSQKHWLEFTYKKQGNVLTKLYQTMCKVLGIEIELPQKEIEKIERFPVNDAFSNIEGSVLNGWIRSPGHNRLLLTTEGTHYSFKIMETMHYNLRYIHAVLIMARRDTVQQPLSKK